MKKLVIFFTVFLVSIPAFASDNAVITKTTGRVEIMAPGGGWKTAEEGDFLSKGSSISTGFNSRATLEVGASTLEVEPLTRMTLDQLVRTGSKQTTEINIRIGRVKADVKRDTGLSHDFKLRNPSATAAVRGTEFSFGSYDLKVTHGSVAFSENVSGRKVLVGKGESSRITGSGKMYKPVEELAKSASTETSTAKKENGDAQSSASRTSGASGSPTAGTGSGAGTGFYGTLVISID